MPRRDIVYNVSPSLRISLENYINFLLAKWRRRRRNSYIYSNLLNRTIKLNLVPLGIISRSAKNAAMKNPKSLSLGKSRNELKVLFFLLYLSLIAARWSIPNKVTCDLALG